MNLKILLRAVEDAGLLDRAGRNRLLEACAADVVRAVLADSERQALAISVAEGYGVTVLDRNDQAMRNLEEHALRPHARATARCWGGAEHEDALAWRSDSPSCSLPAGLKILRANSLRLD